MSFDIGRIQPAILPPDYSLRATRIGDEVDGFLGATDQVAFIYTLADDWTHPLMINFATGGGSLDLFATETRPGESVALRSGTVQARYHDGMWAPGPGFAEQQLGELLIHWMQDTMHSLTVNGQNESIGVRGSRARGIRLTDLVTVAESLPTLAD